MACIEALHDDFFLLWISILVHAFIMININITLRRILGKLSLWLDCGTVIRILHSHLLLQLALPAVESWYVNILAMSFIWWCNQVLYNFIGSAIPSNVIIQMTELLRCFDISIVPSPTLWNSHIMLITLKHTSFVKCDMELLIHSLISTVAPLNIWTDK